MNLSDYDGPQTFDMLTTQINQNSLSNVVLNKTSLEENNSIEVDEINSDKQSSKYSKRELLSIVLLFI